MASSLHLHFEKNIKMREKTYYDISSVSWWNQPCSMNSSFLQMIKECPGIGYIRHLCSALFLPVLEVCRQILGNLLFNSIEVCEPHGHLWLARTVMRSSHWRTCIYVSWMLMVCQHNAARGKARTTPPS